jgi:hypothetical protein
MSEAMRVAWREELSGVMLSKAARLALDGVAAEADVDNVTFGQLADAIIEAYDLAEDRHLVRFTETGWTIQHPVAERMVGMLLDCEIHRDRAEDLATLPESGPGDYWLVSDGLEAV